jgi:hypothetical protein
VQVKPQLLLAFGSTPVVLTPLSQYQLRALDQTTLVAVHFQKSVILQASDYP